jgi:uncharacterized protein YjbI with pentapeptide repeats
VNSLRLRCKLTHRDARVILGAAVVIGATLVLFLPTIAWAAPPTTVQLQREKLRQEIRQLQLDNRNHTGIRGFLGTYGGLVAGVAALGTVLVALTNLVHQRNLDRLQRRTEGIRRLDERFSAILADLGAVSEAQQAAAAVSLLTFLRAEHRDYHRQVRLVALANLKVREPGPVTMLLIRALSDALRTPEPIQSDEVDFAGAELTGINLAGLDLRNSVLREAKLNGADLTKVNLQGVDAYKVQLRGACLSGADLREAHFESANARKAVFHDQANLNAVKFHDAVLTEARFESSNLQSAHFDRAHLEGARFQSADINDAFIRPASFDDATLQSLNRAKNKWKANFSSEIRKELTKLDPEGEAQSRKMRPNPDRGQRGVAPGE